MPFNTPGVFEDHDSRRKAALTRAGRARRRHVQRRRPREPRPGTPHAGDHLRRQRPRHQVRRRRHRTLNCADASAAVIRRRAAAAARAHENLPKLYGLQLAAPILLDSVSAVKWVLLTVLGMLALGFVLLYRKGNPLTGDFTEPVNREIIESPKHAAVAADRVWKYFGDYPALRGANLDVASRLVPRAAGPQRRGQDHAAAHPRRLSKPSKGEVNDVAGRARIGYLGHGIGVYDDLSAFENLTALRPAAWASPNPAQRRRRSAGTRRSRAREGRPGPRIFARHAAAPGRRARLPAPPRNAAARRAVHFARRPRHRGPADAAARRLAPRRDHHHVDAPDPRSHGTGDRRRAAGARQDRPRRPAHRRDAGRSRLALPHLRRASSQA